MKNKEITLLKNNQKRNWEDQKWIEEFYSFLQGEVPEGITLGRGHQIKLTPNKAMSIIWYLQEHFSILPDHYEQCSMCKSIYNSWSEGHWSDKKGKGFCGYCDTYHNNED